MIIINENGHDPCQRSFISKKQKTLINNKDHDHHYIQESFNTALFIYFFLLQYFDKDFEAGSRLRRRFQTSKTFRMVPGKLYSESIVRNKCITESWAETHKFYIKLKKFFREIKSSIGNILQVIMSQIYSQKVHLVTNFLFFVEKTTIFDFEA